MVDLTALVPCVTTLLSWVSDQAFLVAAIWTAAMAMLGGGDAVKDHCRTTDIMSDAAYSILTRNSREFTGNFVVDEEILKQDGVTDLEKYSCIPGE